MLIDNKKDHYPNDGRNIVTVWDFINSSLKSRDLDIDSARSCAISPSNMVIIHRGSRQSIN